MPDTHDVLSMNISDVYWVLAARRMERFYANTRELRPGEPAYDNLVTPDPILDRYKFTNTHRAADRASQYLIHKVQLHGPQDPKDVLFRTLLYKLFNKPETWEIWLNAGIGLFSENFSPDVFLNRLEGRKQLMSTAYMNPFWSSPVGYPDVKSHAARALQMVDWVMSNKNADAMIEGGLRRTYSMLTDCANIGPFLGYQLATDLGYHHLFNFNEMDFTTPGPQAKEGIARHRNHSAVSGPMAEDSYIRWMCDRQEEEFKRLDLEWSGLFGRRLSLIDCQNIFCEYAKYIRLANIVESNLVYFKNSKTKKSTAYKRHPQPLKLLFPLTWGINPLIPTEARHQWAEQELRAERVEDWYNNRFDVKDMVRDV